MAEQDDEYLSALDMLHKHLGGDNNHPLYREFLRFVNTARVGGEEAWRCAILNELAGTGMDAQLDEPPYSILQRIINWHVDVSEQVGGPNG